MSVKHIAVQISHFVVEVSVQPSVQVSFYSLVNRMVLFFFFTKHLTSNICVLSQDSVHDMVHDVYMLRGVSVWWPCAV